MIFDLNFALKEKVIVYDEGRLTVSFLDGKEVECTVK